MASLKKLDVIIRGNSTITIDGAVKWVKNWSDERQEESSNKDKDGRYIKEFFVELFDSRDSSTYKIFCTYSTEIRRISNTYTCENGDKIKGVITVFVKEQLITEILNKLNNSNSTNSNINIEYKDITTNPYTLESDVKFAIANTDNDAAEIRIMGNEVTIFDAGGFVDNNTLYDVSENKPLHLEILTLKG